MIFEELCRKIMETYKDDIIINEPDTVIDDSAITLDCTDKKKESNCC